MPNGESPVVPKREELRDELVSPLESLHEDDIQTDIRAGRDTGLGAERSPVQKRKGGRKPLYATTEERKQRNRRAQAAFRERRTEHIKQLETDIKHMQETVKSLEHSQQRAKDECLMLRYKNSLLENLLLQKNIDFQKEIQQSGMSYSPQQVPRNPVPLHRAVHQQRMRPSPVNVGNQSPLVSGAQSTANASPIQPPMSAFTFSPPGYTPSGSQPPTQPGFVHGARPPGQTLPPGQMSSNISSPSNTRRPSATQQWNVGSFQGDLDANASTFALDAEPLRQPNNQTAALQGQQYQDLAAAQNSHQFGLMGQGQFAQSQPTIGQVLEHGSHAQGTMGHQQGHQTAGMTQDYNLMGHDLGAYGLSTEGDLFGIDRSMQYPTQFDFQGTQRRPQ